MKQLQAIQLTSAIGAISLGLIFMTNYWFPGVFFAVGASVSPLAMVKGRWSWYITQFAILMIGLSVVFLEGFNNGILFLVFGAMILFAILKPEGGPFYEKAKN